MKPSEMIYDAGMRYGSKEAHRVKGEILDQMAEDILQLKEVAKGTQRVITGKCHPDIFIEREWEK